MNTQKLHQKATDIKMKETLLKVNNWQCFISENWMILQLILLVLINEDYDVLSF